MKRTVHGDWQVLMQGRVMVLTLTGPFNSHGVTQLHADSAALLGKLLVRGLIAPPLASLVDLRNWQLLTPDCGEAMTHMFERMAAVGFTHVAYISTTGTLRQAVLEEFWAKVPEVTRYYACSQESASQWLAQHGFDVPETSARRVND